MRVVPTLLLALPVLVAAEGPFDQYVAKFQNFLGSFGVNAPGKETPKTSEAPPAKAKVAHKPMQILTLNNWKDTLYSPVKPDATKPEEWWVLVTGGNKTCFGKCYETEFAFNETASKFAALPNTPRTALLNCDNEPVLCNLWAAGSGYLWAFDMLPPPAPINISTKRLNLTTTTPKTFFDLQSLKARNEFRPLDSWFHPFDGVLAKNGVALPLAYVFNFFNIVPNWLMMIVVSFISRSMMSKRMAGPTNQERARAAQAGAAAPAPARAP